MINLLKKPVYIAKRIIDDNSSITKYEAPEKYYIDVQPTGGNTELLAYGERIYSMYTGVVNAREFRGKFKEGDVAYINTDPDNEEVNGYKADFVIVSIREYNKTISIHFEKIQK